MMEKITHQQALRVDEFDIPRETAFSIDPKEKVQGKEEGWKIATKRIVMDNFRLPKPLDEKAKQSAPNLSDYAEVIIAELALNLQNLAPLDGRELPEIKILCYADKIIVQYWLKNDHSKKRSTSETFRVDQNRVNNFKLNKLRQQSRPKTLS